MRFNALPRQKRLHDLLIYSPETGEFLWRNRRTRPELSGKPAGSITVWGYRVIGIDGTQYQAARVAWKYMTGREPPAELDHENGDTLDYRWRNLRIATHTQNAQNMKNQRRKYPLPKGVWHSVLPGRFQAVICVNKRRLYLGLFDTPEQAHAAYMRAAERYFGQFARAS